MSAVLCIDDEPAILRLLDVVLRRDGHSVIAAKDARAALAAVDSQPIDAIVLDLGLPDRDGIELLATLRARTPAPIIVLSARTDVSEKVTALDLGASDYVTKPFEGDELLARLRAALRSTGRATPGAEILIHGSLYMDVARHVLKVGDRPVALTPKEFAVLRELITAGGRVLTHTAILESIWGKAHRNDVEYLRVVIRALRLKIEADPSSPALIRNEPGIGYRLA